MACFGPLALKTHEPTQLGELTGVTFGESAHDILPLSVFGYENSCLFHVA